MSPTIELGFSILKGGRTLVKPVIEEVQWLPLNTMTVPVVVQEAITKSGVRLSVDVITQVKIKSDPYGLIAAAEQLLGKSEDEIGEIAQKNLEGHIRSACAQLEIEVINNDRAALASRIQEEAVPDLAKLGLEITTFTVKDIADKAGYLDALGKKRVAEVLAAAQIGAAEAQRDAAIKIAQAKRDQEAAQAETLEKELRIRRSQAQADGVTKETERQAEIAEAEKGRNVRIEAARGETSKAKAIADVAYEIQQTTSKQVLADRQKELASRQADAEFEIRRKEVIVPAEAAAKAVAATAFGAKEAILRNAEAEGEAIRIKGKAEADAILAKGEAHAEALRLTAEAYEAFGDAALADRIASLMPAIAKEFAGAFQNTEKIVILEGGSGSDGAMGNSFAKWLTSAMTTIPELVQSTTGKNVTDLIEEVAMSVKGTKSANKPSK